MISFVFILGFVFLIKGADILVKGVSVIAKRVNVSNPELFTSAVAAYRKIPTSR